MHEDCRKHTTTNFHKTSSAAAKTFFENVSFVDIQLQSFYQKTIKENKQLLASLISCIVFCGTHDLAVSGKEADKEVF